jgi:hypothetical protein
MRQVVGVIRPFFYLLCAGAIALHASVVFAQPRTGQVAGLVVDHSTGTGVAADIQLAEGGRHVVADSAGAYAFSDLPAGIVRFIVRAHGFPTTRVAVALVRGERLAHVIELDSTAVQAEPAQPLPAVSVAALPPPSPRYADFERRRLNGRGQYLVKDDLDKAGYSTLQDAMLGLRGVNVDCGGGSGCTIRMARAPMRCSPEYIIDERTDNTFGPYTPLRDIEGIEVYTGPSDVPGEFAGRSAGCGVVVVWTRAGPTPKRPE